MRQCRQACSSQRGDVYSVRFTIVATLIPLHWFRSIIQLKVQLSSRRMTTSIPLNTHFIKSRPRAEQLKISQSSADFWNRCSLLVHLRDKCFSSTAVHTQIAQLDSTAFEAQANRRKKMTCRQNTDPHICPLLLKSRSPKVKTRHAIN